MDATPATSAHVVATGKVQGVGYRWFVRRHAEALGLSGWVRNRREGSVELELCGPRPAIVRLLEELRAGPPASDVRELRVNWLPLPTHGAPEGFAIRPTE